MTSGPVAADGAGEIAAQLQGVRELAVGVVEERHVFHTHHPRARELFGRSDDPGLLGIYRVDAGLAPGGEHVLDHLPCIGPASDG